MQKRVSRNLPMQPMDQELVSAHRCDVQHIFVPLAPPNTYPTANISARYFPSWLDVDKIGKIGDLPTGIKALFEETTVAIEIVALRPSHAPNYNPSVQNSPHQLLNELPNQFPRTFTSVGSLRVRSESYAVPLENVCRNCQFCTSPLLETPRQKSFSTYRSPNASFMS